MERISPITWVACRSVACALTLGPTPYPPHHPHLAAEPPGASQGVEVRPGSRRAVEQGDPGRPGEVVGSAEISCPQQTRTPLLQCPAAQQAHTLTLAANETFLTLMSGRMPCFWHEDEDEHGLQVCLEGGPTACPGCHGRGWPVPQPHGRANHINTNTYTCLRPGCVVPVQRLHPHLPDIATRPADGLIQRGRVDHNNVILLMCAEGGMRRFLHHCH